jgi:hypothetical protein
MPATVPHAQFRNVRRMASVLLAAAILMCSIATCASAHAFSTDGERFSFGVRLGSIGINNGGTPATSHYSVESTPVCGVQVGVRIYKYVWTQVRYERRTSPLMASLGPFDETQIGELGMSSWEVIPVVLEWDAGPKWRGMVFPFSYIHVEVSVDVEPDLYYYPGYGEDWYKVLGVDVNGSSGFGLLGGSLEYRMTPNVTAGVECWCGRGSMPRASMDVYELGRREVAELMGLATVFDISVYVGACF